MRSAAVAKLFGENERVVVLATDHRYFGVYSGLEKPGEVIKPLLPYTDILMTDPGILRNYLDRRTLKTPVILRASGCSSVADIEVPGYLQLPAKHAYKQMTGKDFDTTFKEYSEKAEKGQLSETEEKEYTMMNSVIYMPDTIANERLILHGQDVIDEGGAGAAISVYIGTAYQTQTLDNLATMSREVRKFSLPVLGVVAVGKALGYLERDADYLTRAGVILVAHGADIVKTYNCGKGFEKVVEACGVPVVVAGGRLPKGKDATVDSIELAYDCMQKGAAGIDFGRRVWRHEHPVAMIRSLNEIVHHDATIDEALEKYHEWVREENA
ncbi:MAG: hypothetical protein HZB67_00035 [Candidatus Aenigmarchaeota archaeon]|nr:hypothetical protein [Candidatus Aenigmarchaeota archaeon]